MGKTNNKSQVIDKKNVVSFAGAFVAFLIGSGFATGQEIMQYFAAYGFKGIINAGIAFVLFVYVGISFITNGYEQKFENGNDIYRYYGGKYIGTFYDYFSVIFIYMSFIVMIAGAGAAVNQQYGLPVAVGGILMGVVAGITVIFGLNSIVDVIGKIGPAIIVMSFLLGIISIIKNPGGLSEVSAVLPTLDLLKASKVWFLAPLSYVGFCMLWLAAFVSQLGKTANSKKEGALGITFGTVAFCVTIIVVTLGLLANLKDVAGSMIPSLVLAEKIHPVVAIVFSLLVVLGIYTTAVPLLWTVSSRIAKEKTKKFTIVTLILATIGVLIGLFVPFDKLVNIIYGINGYVGIFLLILMVVKDIRVKTSKKDAATETVTEEKATPVTEETVKA